MNIISYNINGIRAAFTKNLLNWIEQSKLDILCFQEIKANEDQIDVKSLEDLGYFCYWFSAKKKGYSGVGIISKIKPNNIEFGCQNEDYDNEGRVLRLDFDNFSVIIFKSAEFS